MLIALNYNAFAQSNYHYYNIHKTVLFYDDFTSNGNNWADGKAGMIKLTNGYYHIESVGSGEEKGGDSIKYKKMKSTNQRTLKSK